MYSSESPFAAQLEHFLGPKRQSEEKEALLFTGLAGHGSTFLLSTTKNEVWVFGQNCPATSINLNRGMSSVQRLLLASAPIADMCLGSYLCALVTQDGSAYGWGQNTFNEISSSGTAAFEAPRRMAFSPGTADAPEAPRDSVRDWGNTEDSNEGKTAFEASKAEDSSEPVHHSMREPPHDSSMGRKQKSSMPFQAVRTCPESHTTFYLSTSCVASVGPQTSAILGHTKKQQPIVPRMLSMPVKVAGVAPGISHVLCWSNSGKTFAWGKNSFGKCGVKNNKEREKEDIRVPEEVAILQDVKIIEMVAGAAVSFGITHKGKLFFWGRCSLFTLGCSRSTRRSHSQRKK